MKTCEVNKIDNSEEKYSRQDYVLSDTTVYNPEFNLEQLEKIRDIEFKLKDYTSGKSKDGISKEEAELLLDWVILNARKYALRYTFDSIETDPMTGQCCPTQTFNYKLLGKMGLTVIPFNTEDAIGEIPMAEEDIKRVENGWNSPALRHSVILVEIPIIDENGETQKELYLLDPTFGQFCLKKNCEFNCFFKDINGRKGIAPHPGYFIQSENLRKYGVSDEEAIETENLGRRIISRGHFPFNEKNAKLYGDIFVRASERKEFQRADINKTGAEYIENIKTHPMQIIDFINEHENSFVKLPSELEELNPNVFSRAWKRFCGWIASHFNSKGTDNRIKQFPISSGNEQKGVGELTEEQLRSFRNGEESVLHSLNTGKDNINGAEKEEKKFGD